MADGTMSGRLTGTVGERRAHPAVGRWGFASRLHLLACSPRWRPPNSGGASPVGDIHKLFQVVTPLTTPSRARPPWRTATPQHAQPPEITAYRSWHTLRHGFGPWLVLDHDGSVLVAASSTRLRKHGIVRIRADRNGAKVDRVLMGTGALGMAPWVDATGYALPIWQSTTKLPKVVRRATLGGSQGSWKDVGQCF